MAWRGNSELDEVKSVLRTMEDVRWTIVPEPKKAKERNTTRAKPKPKKLEPGLF